MNLRQNRFLVCAFLLILNSAIAFSADPSIQRRVKPQLESRIKEASTVGQNLLWIPRIIFFPAYLVTEYGFRVPLRALGRAAELNNLPFLVADFFKFGEDNRFAIYPSLLIDFGFRPSFGFRFRWKNFFTDRNRLKIRAATGGTDYGILSLVDEWEMSPKTHFKLAAEIGRRPDFIFHAIGPLASEKRHFRYALIRKEVGIGLVHETERALSLDFQTGVRDFKFANGSAGNDPTIDAGIAAGIFPAPPRYPGGYSSFAQRLDVNWGGRVSRPKAIAGGILDALVDHSFDFSGGGWWIYGGALTGYFDLNGRSRVISLKGEVEFSSGYGGKSTPFNELPTIGGNRLLGFLDRRFIDASAMAMTFEYKWPVQSILDGIIHFGVGNVFGHNLEGIRWGLLRKSLGFGIEATGGKSSTFGLLIALGSEPFERGGDFNEFRLSLRFGGGI